MKKVVLIYSGGLDSTVMLYDLKAQGDDVKALSIDYGQRHKKEIEAAKYHCRKLDIEHQIADMTGITHLLAGSSQTSADLEVPDGHYAEESMKLTVVPNRNMIMLSVAIGWAISQKADSVAYAAHSGDHAIYPDCRPEFAEAIDRVTQLADWHQISLLRPFVALTKSDLVTRGHDLGVEFGLTWSCYKGGQIHCGTCGTCVERREAFALARITDPTPYGL